MLELVKLIDGNEYCRRFPLFGQHDALTTMLRAGYEFIQMITSLWQGKARAMERNFTRTAAGGPGLTRETSGQP